MSADNGIYILETLLPHIKEGHTWRGYEYRVAECQAIDNLDYSDLYMPILFGESQVFESEFDAMKEAMRLAKSVSTEYGISLISKERCFPNITARAASIALDCHVGAVPVDVHKQESP